MGDTIFESGALAESKMHAFKEQELEEHAEAFVKAIIASLEEAGSDKFPELVHVGEVVKTEAGYVHESLDVYLTFAGEAEKLYHVWEYDEPASYESPGDYDSGIEEVE